MNRKTEKMELIFAGIMLVLSLLLIFVFIPTQTKVSSMETTMQPSVFPTVAAVIIGGTSILQIVLVLLKRIKPEQVVDGETNGRRFLIVLSGILAYILLVKYIGFYVITFITMVAMQRFYARNKWITAIVANVIFLAIVYALFEMALQISMPRGLLV